MTKKIFLALIGFFAATAFAESAPDFNGKRILVAYFSRTGENYNVGTIQKGNTHIVADIIAEKLGASTFEIKPASAYPNDYDACTKLAKQEKAKGVRPKLATAVQNFESYDVIFLGYPIWWSDLPMAVYTFLESYDFSGKTIIPFCTHEGSGLSGTEQSLREKLPNSKILGGLAISGNTAQKDLKSAQKQVFKWLQKIGF